MKAGRALLSAAALLLAACAEEPQGIQPLPPAPTEARPAPIAEAPSPAIVSPHLRRTDAADRPARDLRRPSGTGGGRIGGSAAEAYGLRPIPTPSAREVEAFRRQLEREAQVHVDRDDDPCDQLLGVMRATAAAAPPGPHAFEAPSRAELRRRCPDFSRKFQECMSPEYFQAHLDECNAEIARLAERGERRQRTRQRQWEAIERGGPWPGESTREPTEGG